jgi:hypothetical protein
MTWMRAKRASIPFTFSEGRTEIDCVTEVLILFGVESVEFVLEFFWGACVSGHNATIADVVVVTKSLEGI